MRRRAFLLSALAFAAGRPARAASQGVPVIGFLGFATPDADRLNLEALARGFRELGYDVGRNLILAARHADGRADLAPALVRELEAEGTTVFISPGPAAALALRRLTRKPIVSVALPPTPDRSELYQSLARPGGNLTGLSNFGEELSVKRVELVRDVLPGVQRFGVIHNAVDPIFRDWGIYTERALRGHGFAVTRLEVDSARPETLRALLGPGRIDGIQALLPIRDFLTSTLRDEICRIALARRIPVVAEHREFVEAGALMSYGADMLEQFRLAAGYADRILKGAAPGDLPIQLPSKLYLAVNLVTARALGIALPEWIVNLADEVRE